MANPKIRIKIPIKPVEIIALAKRVDVKHLADGTSSPLNIMQTNSWGTVGPIATECMNIHLEAEEYSRKAEELYDKRDTMLKQIDDAVKASRDLLIGLYRNEPKKLGEWGFEVDDSPRQPKAKV